MLAGIIYVTTTVTLLPPLLLLLITTPLLFLLLLLQSLLLLWVHCYCTISKSGRRSLPDCPSPLLPHYPPFPLLLPPNSLQGDLTGTQQAGRVQAGLQDQIP